MWVLESIKEVMMIHNLYFTWTQNHHHLLFAWPQSVQETSVQVCRVRQLTVTTRLGSEDEVDPPAATLCPVNVDTNNVRNSPRAVGNSLVRVEFV